MNTVSSTIKSNSSKVNIRFLVNETLHKGTFIDRKIDGSNTLLHLAVEYNLSDCVIKLLSSGASINLMNSNGCTAKDIALNNGNQILLQLLGRREDYGKHLQVTCGMDSTGISKNTAEVYFESKMLPLTIGAVYEDYLDWTDTKRCQRLKELIESLKSDGSALNITIAGLCDRKASTVRNLQHIHDKLRNKEHALCLQVWDLVHRERTTRRDLSSVSQTVAELKSALAVAQVKVAWAGEVQVRTSTSGVFVTWSSWVDVGLEVTGEALLLSALLEGLSVVADQSLHPNDGELWRSPAARPPASARSGSRPSSPLPPFVSLSTGPLRRRLHRHRAARQVAERCIFTDCITGVDVNCEYTSRGELSAQDIQISFRTSRDSGTLEQLHLRVSSSGSTVDNTSDMEAVARAIASVSGAPLSRQSCRGGVAIADSRPVASLASHFAQEALDSDGLSDSQSPIGSPTGVLCNDKYAAGSLSTIWSGAAIEKEICLGTSATRESVTSSGLTSLESYVMTSMHSSGHGSHNTGTSSFLTQQSWRSSSVRPSLSGACGAECNVDKPATDGHVSPGNQVLCEHMQMGVESRIDGGRRRSIDSLDRDSDSAFPGRDWASSSAPPLRRASTSTSGARLEGKDSLSVRLNRAVSSSTVESESRKDIAQLRDVSSLKRELEDARARRNKSEKQLVQVITMREKVLEKLHFLQALRAVVDNPPKAPTRTLWSAKTPSVEKAMAMLSVYREHVDHVNSADEAESCHTDDLSSAHRLQYVTDRRRLSEAEDFVKIMLQESHLINEMGSCPAAEDEVVRLKSAMQTLNRRNNDESLQTLSPHHSMCTPNIVIPSSRQEQELVYGLNSRDVQVSMSVRQQSCSMSTAAESGLVFASTPSRAASSSTSWHQRESESLLRSPFAEALCEAAQSPLVSHQPRFSSSPNPHCAHEPELSIRSSPWKAAALKELITSSGGPQRGESGVEVTPPGPAKLTLDSRSPGAICSHQVFGAPPQEFQEDFDEVMRQLEDVWNCELETFEAVGRLAQCLVLREQTGQRLSRLKTQETSLLVPDQEDLYDIEL